MSYATRYAALKRQQETARANTPEAAEWRRKNAGVNAQVRREAAERYPDMAALAAEGPDAVREMVDWQAARYLELSIEAGTRPAPKEDA